MGNILILVVATMVLVSIPGPNVALIVANSLQDGLRSGFVTVFGTTFGVAIQLALVVLGMAAGLRNRVTGALLILAGIGLALARRA